MAIQISRTILGSCQAPVPAYVRDSGTNVIFRLHHDIAEDCECFEGKLSE